MKKTSNTSWIEVMSGWLHPKFTIQNIGSVPRYFKHWLKYPRAWSGQIARLPNFSWMCSYSGTRMFCWEKGLKIRKKDISQKIAGNKKSRFWERIIIAPAGLERSLFICLLQGDFVENDLNLQKQHQKTSSWKCFTVYTPLWPLKYTGVPFDQCYNSVAEVLSSEMTCSAHAFTDQWPNGHALFRSLTQQYHNLQNWISTYIKLHFSSWKHHKSKL